MATEKNMKRTPIYELGQAAGAVFVADSGWSVIDRFPQRGGAGLAREGVGLADRSARGKILLQGDGAGELLARWQGVRELAVHEGAACGEGHCFRLRHDIYFLSMPPGLETATVTAGEGAVTAADGLVTITDVTHGRAELWLVGPAARQLLSRLCGLDFHPDAFPNLTAKQSSVAKTQQLVIRRDVGRNPAYALIGARSLGAYLWQTVGAAGHDLPFALLGKAGLHELEGEAG